MRLDRYENSNFSRGASKSKEALWLCVSGLIVESWVPGSKWRVALLRMFGAIVGKGVVIKPHVRVKFPWCLTIGDHSWIGENVWIDNLTDVYIGSHVCISQGAYLCTGSHDWSRDTFDLILRPIIISNHAWVCAFAVLAPGTNLGEGAILGISERGNGALPAWTVTRSGICKERNREPGE